MPSRFAGSIAQDWEPVVLSKRKPKSGDLKDPKAVNQALRTGAMVETVKKHEAGSNKKTATSGPVVYGRKLDEQTEPAGFEKVGLEVRSAIQKARLGKKMSQAELGKLINERAQVVQEYESGKAVPNQAVLAKMESAWGEAQGKDEVKTMV
ncbi:putative transcription factor protein [Dioscorea alata]|uniref:Transcription factor protein n=1 Tax=Dioscorea alata TaxID=55571 RepID=A0ACB7UAN0_DIOAL|nr:putative transcription factor protein [Dioscorea alata]